MTDEMQVNQPSKAPYVVGGGLVTGGLGALAATKWDTARQYVSDVGKYNSYEDLIKEKKDKFESTVKDIENKDTVEAATNIRKEVNEKIAAYKTELDNHVNTSIKDKIAGKSEEDVKALKEEATKLFEKEKGTLEEITEKAINEGKEKYGERLSGIVTKFNKTKLGLAIAGCAAVGLLLGAAIAPKHKNS